MNRKNILEIARALIDKVGTFNMGSGCFDNECGSAGCIAGHIAYLHPRKSVGVTRYNHHGHADNETIRSQFKISSEDATFIFVGDGYYDRYRDMTRWTAAAGLVRYLRTREVDFKRVGKRRAIEMVETAEREFLK